MITEITLSSGDNSNINIYPNNKLSNTKYVADVITTGKAADGQAVDIIAFQLHDRGFESLHRRSTSPHDDGQLTTTPFLKNDVRPY